MKSTLLLIVFAAIGLSLGAGTVRFRSGKVLAAELTTAKIKINNINPDVPPAIPNKPVYAVVSVKLDDLRNVSIFDYVLTSYGREFPCIAVRSGNNFDFADNPVSANGVIQLLFAADGLLVGKLPQETLILKSKFPPKGLHDAKLTFTNLGSKAPSAISAIPAGGSFNAPEKK